MGGGGRNTGRYPKNIPGLESEKKGFPGWGKQKKSIIHFESRKGGKKRNQA